MTSTGAPRICQLVAAIGMMGLCAPQFAAQQSHAADIFWENDEGGFFSEPSNWFVSVQVPEGRVPGKDDVARFETTDANCCQRAYIVDFTDDPFNQQLVVEDDDVTFNLMGHTYELTNPFVAVALGQVRHPDRSGDLTVINGTLMLPVEADLEIASFPDTKGSLTVGADGKINGSKFLGGPKLKVGLNGKGTLEISNGGFLNAHSVTIGENSGSTGTEVTVAGNGSLLQSGNLMMSSAAGSGTLRIEPGGKVTADDVHLGGNHELRLEGGSLQVESMSNSPGFIWTSGTLLCNRFSGDLTIPNGGVLVGGSRVDGTLTLLQGATNQISVDREFNIVFPIHVDEHVVIAGGNLQLALEGGILPSPEDKFEIITTGLGISGSFANVANGQRLAVGHGSFLVNYGPGSAFDPKSVVLSSFQTATAGDFDVDGDVGGNDFLVWQRGGSPNHGSSADLVAWRVNFGTGGAAAATDAVPEASANALLLSGLFLLIVRSRKGVFQGGK